MSQESESEREQKLPLSDKLNNYSYGFAGAVAGGFIAYYAVDFLYTKHGLYAPILPGCLVGLGCAAATWGRKLLMGLMCAAIAVPAHVFAESKIRLDKNGKVFNSVKDFAGELLEGRHSTVLMFIGIGAVCAFFIGRVGWRRVGETKLVRNRQKQS